MKTTRRGFLGVLAAIAAIPKAVAAAVSPKPVTFEAPEDSVTEVTPGVYSIQFMAPSEVGSYMFEAYTHGDPITGLRASDFKIEKR